MTLTTFEPTNAAPPAWWSQGTGPGGEVDAADTNVGGAVEEGFGFADLLDVINPLQHIPIVSTLYRQLTGDTIAEAPRMMGSALWGGPMGIAAALTDSVVRGETGRDTGAAAVAWLTDTPAEPELDSATLAAITPTEQLAVGEQTPLGQTPTGMMPAALAGGMKTNDPASADTRLIGRAASDQMATSPGVFQGRDADRLDAFIRKANSVRPPSAPALGALTSNNFAAPKELAPPTAQPATPRADAADTLSAPAGGTDVSRWMLNALDRYQTMKRAETS